MIHRVVDYFRPDNCRTLLREAAEENRKACDDLMCFLQSHRETLEKRKSDAA